MHFEVDQYYHLYNTGNNRNKIFFFEQNYDFFLKKIYGEWSKYCEFLGYSLLPNEFNFLVRTNYRAFPYLIIKQKELHLQRFSSVIGQTLSSYAYAINQQQHRSGVLFQKKTKANWIKQDSDNESENHLKLVDCLQNIHNRPVLLGLCRTPEEWPYSSARYCMKEDEFVINKELITAISRQIKKAVPV